MRLRFLIAIVAFLILGFAIPRLIPDGIDRYKSDPTAYAVALEAKRVYWIFHPIAHVISPGLRVTRVWKEPGHCHDTRPRDESGEYRAEVRGLLWFGIPGPTVDVQCGAWYYAPKR